MIIVEFSVAGEKKINPFVSAANGIITVDVEGFTEKMTEYKDILTKEESIKNAVEYAEKEFIPYIDILRG